MKLYMKRNSPLLKRVLRAEEYVDSGWSWWEEIESHFEEQCDECSQKYRIRPGSAEKLRVQCTHVRIRRMWSDAPVFEWID